MLVASSPEAFEAAAQWLHYELVDQKTGHYQHRSLQISSLQRFVLGWFWFHTTNSGASPWISCNPPNAQDGDTAECEFLTSSLVEVVDGDPVICYDAVPAMRWLSAAHECEWAGITCDGNEQVVSIELIGVALTGTFPSFLRLLPNKLSRHPHSHQRHDHTA